MATQLRPAAPDYLALVLLAFALMNLNGVVFFLTQREGALSLLLAFPITLYLVANYARISNISEIFGLFVLFCGLFLVGSAMPGLINQDNDLVRLQSYAITMLFISAVYLWAATLNDSELENVLRIAKGMLLITSLGTIFSGQLAEIFDYGFAIERASGFFLDPNQAAVAALYCLVLVVAFPARSPLLTLAQGGIALTALIMTFSRMALLTFFVLCLLYFLRKPSIKAMALFFVGMILLISALWSIFEFDLFGLNWEQRRRLADVLGILTGEVGESTAGGRTELWDIGLRRIAQVFPWGAGIGQFHQMEHGLRAGHGQFDWLGIHNTYLMILGEAGLAAFIAFLAFLARMIWKSANSAFGVFAIGSMVVFLSSMMTSHGILGQRLPNVMLAFVMVIAAHAPTSRMTLFMPQPVPRGPRQ